MPVVAVASAAPAMAASGPIHPSFTPGTFCKHPGNPKWYHAVFCFRNTSDEDIKVTVLDLDVNGIVRDAKFSVNNALTDDYTVQGNTTACLYVDAGLYDNSANGAATLTFSYVYGGLTIPGSVSGGTIVDKSLPPCGSGADPSDPKQPSDDPPHSSSGPVSAP